MHSLRLLFVAGITATSWASDHNALRHDAVALLQREFAANDGWIGIHAAEALVEHEQTSGIAARYQRELASASPPYRIGVWRVLARVGPEAERAGHRGKIRAALRDEKGPDRVHAIETLAKLNAATPAERGAIEQWLVAANSADSAYLLWAKWQLAEAHDRAAVESRISVLLTGQPHAVISRAAYVLARLPRISSATLEKIHAEIAANSASTAPLFAAALAHTPAADQRHTALRTAIRSRLDGAAPGEQLELAVALGRYGAREDLTALQRLASAAHPDGRIGAASGILHLLRRLPARE